MYIPKHFQVADQAALYQFIAAHSFATLVSVIDGAPFATHLPLLVDLDEAGNATLLGHVARANEHHHVFDGEHETLAIFSGPHAYVSPAWYADSPAVPTWNYAAVHAYGRPQAMDTEDTLAFVERLTRHFDPDLIDRPEVTPEYRRKLARGIVGLRMPVERLEGKYKLSQNRNEADQRGVIEALGDDGVASMMRERLAP